MTTELSTVEQTLATAEDIAQLQTEAGTEVEPEVEPKQAPSTLATVARNGVAVFDDLAAGDYLVSVYFSHHTQSVSVNGASARACILPPNSNREIGVGVFTISGSLKITVDAPDKVSCDVLVTLVPVQYVQQ